MNVVAWLSCCTKIFCASRKNVSSVFSVADCALETNSRLRKIGSRSSLSGLLALNHRRAGFNRLDKVVICVLCSNKFVVYSMRNPVVYRTAKRAVFC